MCLSRLVSHKQSNGEKVRRFRISSSMTQEELASEAGVSRADLILFEHSLPVPLYIKRKILGTLWAIRSRQKEEGCPLRQLLD